MSYPLDLDEIPEGRLLEELKKRESARAQGLCDYCKRPPSYGACKFPERHHPEPLGGEFVVDGRDVLGTFGFCGCGDPDAALHLARKILSATEQKGAWDAVHKLLGQSAGAWIVLYHFDHLGLTEHGGNVYGAWLTEKGKGALRLLEKWCSKHPETP